MSATKGKTGCLWLKPATMLRSHLKIAWRHSWRYFLKDRSFSLLNLVGLSTGLACALLIYCWANDEWQVDRCFKNDDRLYQVLQNAPDPTGIATVEQTPGLLAATLKSGLPEVEYAASVIPVSWFDHAGTVLAGERHLEARAEFAGRDYFHVFSYRLIAGNADQALADKHSIVLSKELALSLFPTLDNIVGKSVTWNQKDYNGEYIVSGVFERPPANATAQFDAVLSYDLFLEKNPKLQNWGNNDPGTFVLLREGADPRAFDAKITGWLKSRREDARQTLFAQRYSDRYLHNHYENGAPSGGRIGYVRLFTLIALFILVIACINFMNLSTAKAAGQMKDTGIKKVMGASRASLVAQYLGASLLMTFLSLVVAIGIACCVLGPFNQLTGKHLTLAPDARLLFWAVGITVLTGLLAGSYPAMYLSGFRPVAVLKGRLLHSPGELSVRKTLVVVQFSLSVLFILAVAVVYTQLQFIQSQNLGFREDQLLYFEKGGTVSDNKEDYAPGGKYETDLRIFLQEVKQVPGVVNAANFRHDITNRNGGTYDLSWTGKDPNTRVDFTDLSAGYDFIETMGIQLLAGRTYSRVYGTEKSNIVVNEEAIRVMGMEDPIGKTFRLWGEDRTIIGVVKNFHFQSLHENMKPCFFDLAFNQRASRIMVRVRAGQEKATIGRLERLYSKYHPGYAFQYRFLDDDYQALYASERRVGRLSVVFAGLAVVISCLGLFGLAAFTAQKRQAEIGIRKVLGATVGQVVLLLSGDFIRLVGIAIVIAVPVAWYGADRWLAGFAYRAVVPLWLFALVPVAVMLVAVATISSQSVKAASTNPVKSLRGE
jgi:putative ABC transport system permease protein